MKCIHVAAGISVCLLAAPAIAAAAPVPAVTGATLLVDDTQAVGRIGDGLLSLDEAIRLANGSLAVSSLSAAERARITGTPGPGSGGNTIRIVLGDHGVVTAPAAAPQQSAIATLAGNDGDTIDGGGATLAGAQPTADGLIISSSHVTVRNLTVRGFLEDVVVDFGGRALQDVTIDHVHLMPAALGPLKVGARSSNGSLRGLTVTDSVFDGGTLGSSGAVVLAGTSIEGNSVHNTALENVVFAHNDVSGALEGFYLYGAENNGGEADHAYLRHAKIFDNNFHDSADAALGLDGGTGAANLTTDSGIEDVEIYGNHVVGRNWGIGVWSGEAFAGGVVQRTFVRGVDIHDNVVTGPEGNSAQCIIVESGRADFGSVSTDAGIDHLRITGNDVSNCAVNGIALHGGVPLAAGAVTTSYIHDALIEHNTVGNSALGIVLRGGYATTASVARDNDVSNVRIQNNTLTGDATGIRLVGGETVQAGDVTGNSVKDVALHSNSISGPGTGCVALADAGPGATGNSMGARCQP